MFKNWQDWQGGALDVWKETPASDIGEGLIRHEWQGEKYSLLQRGTTLKADIMNNLQMGLDFLVDSNHTVVNSEDHYVITIDGLKTTNSNPDGYELTENLHFSVKIAEDNGNGISKLIINGDSYDLQKKETGALVELDALDLKADKVCKVYYDGTRFIIDASSLPATDTTAGIISLDEIRDFVFPDQSLVTSGYQKLANGLVIQWGITTGSTSTTDYKFFPVAFDTTVLTGISSHGNISAIAWGSAFQKVDRFKFLVSHRDENKVLSTGSVCWIAIGY